MIKQASESKTPHKAQNTCKFSFEKCLSEWKKRFPQSKVSKRIDHTNKASGKSFKKAPLTEPCRISFFNKKKHRNFKLQMIFRRAEILEGSPQRPIIGPQWATPTKR
jgi:hypothetical protein